MGAFERYSPGQRLTGIPADQMNAWTDAAMDARRKARTGIAGPIREGVDNPVHLVLVSNTTEIDVPTFGTLAYTEPVLLPSESQDFTNRMPLRGIAPTAATHAGRFVIAIEPIPAGSAGYAAVSGVLPALITVNSADHQEVDVGTWALSGDAKYAESVPRGAGRILWKESGTGEKWAIVALSPHSRTRRDTFAVLVTQTGGSSGGTASACTFTYDVTDLAGVSLGTAMTPARPRPTIGKMKAPSAGAYGIGFFDEAGDFVLWDPGEVPDPEVCP